MMNKEKPDFLIDGLLHCGICGKPKEMIQHVLGIELKHHVLCDCECLEMDKERETWKENQRLIRVQNMRIDSIRDKQRRACRFEGAEMNANIRKCQEYVNDWCSMRDRNIGLLMWGTCGNGKSFAAACIANALVDQGVPALMTSFPAILDDKNGVQDIASEMKHYDLVILDDLGAERQSQYALEKVFYVVDERYKSGKPLIVTTNQNLSDMQQYAENGFSDYKRIYDRVLEMCVPMCFAEGSRRKSVRQDKVSYLKETFARRAVQ